jgi:hypothetical protein
MVDWDEGDRDGQAGEEGIADLGWGLEQGHMVELTCGVICMGWFLMRSAHCVRQLHVPTPPCDLALT